MKSLFQAVTLTSVVCAISGPALAVPPLPAPGPEIGDGAAGVAVAAVALLSLVLYPRFKRWRQS
jgi:hypothetical protein